MSQSFTDAFGDKMGISGAILRGTAKFLGLTMRKIVTPAKLGAFERLYARDLQKAVEDNGGEELTYVQRRAVAQQSRRHLDNVMGQIARDNLHTTNKFKDVLANIISYPGWNIGTVRLFGGIGRGAYQLASGQALDMQARLALQYGAGKILRAGIQGAVINKLITGEWPKNIYEIYTWPTGQKDSKGNYIRVSPPEYMARQLLSFAGK